MMIGDTKAVNRRERRRGEWLCKKKPGSKEPGFKVLAT
jgi:hypothetical protein